MTAREQLIKEVEQAPESLVEEVLNFVLFTKTRRDSEALPPKADRAASIEDNREADTKQITEVPERNNRPIWELFDEFTEDLPEEVLAKLPTDGAEQHGHYL